MRFAHFAARQKSARAVAISRSIRSGVDRKGHSEAACYRQRPRAQYGAACLSRPKRRRIQGEVWARRLWADRDWLESRLWWTSLGPPNRVRIAGKSFHIAPSLLRSALAC